MSVQNDKYVIIAAGGTGGHTLPAEALAKALQSRGYKPFIITDTRGQNFFTTPTFALANATTASSSILNVFQRLFYGIKAIGQVWPLLRAHKPIAVIGFGGYPSFPPLVAALLQRIPTIIHEQNAVLGQVNRWLARFVSALALSFPNTQRVPAGICATHTGLPIRKELQTIKSYAPPQPDAPLNLLILGGSQGARILSLVIPDALSLLPSEYQCRLKVHQQARPEDLKNVQETYQKLGIKAEVNTFFKDMEVRLREAHCVICRAGAGTVHELMHTERPALYLPYRLAKDNHQFHNAKYIVQNNGGWMMTEQECTPLKINQFLQEILFENPPLRLQQAATNLRQLAKKDPCLEIITLLQTVTKI